jgi:MtrB/PioB family decaheme-associated outer membrane protein
MRLKLYILIFSLAIVLIPFRAVFAGESGLEGEASVRGQLVNVNGNEAKFNEYSDEKTGIYGNIGLDYQKENYFLRFGAGDIGYDTQKYMIDGGMWGKFKYNMFYTEIPHNVKLDARTYFNGIGNSSLDGDATDPLATWSKFDYTTERKRYGAGLKLEMLKPFFIDVEVMREEKNGNKVAGGGFQHEVPEPVDYLTDSLGVEAGYSKKPFYASLSYFVSKFDNADHLLTVITTSTSTLTLPTDNDYHRFGFKGAVMLPMNSRFSANIGLGEAKSNFRLLNSAGTPFGETFNGKMKTKNYDLVLTSNPVSFLDGKVFYKYYQDKNKSDEIKDTTATDPTTNERISYKKISYGLQVGSKLPLDLRLGAKYAHMKTDFDERLDINRRKDDTYNIDLGWTGLDFLTVNAGYERMNRRTNKPGDFEPEEAIEEFIGRFDVAAFERDTYKVSFDVNPIENLDISLGYKYKKTDYKDTELGLRDDKRDEFYVDANYMINKMVNLFGYFDYEKVRAKQFQRRYVAGNEDPASVEDVNNYNWDVTHLEKNYDYGIGSDVYVIPGKLTLTLQYDNVKSDGNADFTYLFAGVLPTLTNAGVDNPTNSSIDISNSDDYRKQAVSVKAVYNVSNPLTVTAGYAYEQYKYSDAQLDNYVYTGATSSLDFTGAFKDSSYNANVVYATVTYKF